MIIGTWTKNIDMAQVDAVLRGRAPFDDANMVDDGHGATSVADGAALDEARQPTRR